MWIAAYLFCVVAVNAAFTYAPDLSWLWAFGVGIVFVARDYCQRQVGHAAVIGLMALGVLLSYVIAAPFVAFASACAFAASEAMDYGVFSATRRSIADRILWSCVPSAFVDSAIFLGMIHILTPELYAAQVFSKVSAAVLLWALYRAPRWVRT